jgi:NTP pyrophosphohydrolases including oxidative damage repair enzymes
MASYTDLCDCPLAVTLSKPTVLVKAYYDYRRYAVSMKTKDAPPFLQEREVLIAGKVVVVIPIDLVRQQIVLIRQFRLPAHIANGLGDMVEFVAGRVEPNETLVDAARRECREEIGVAPEKTVQLLRYLTTPGSSDEEVTIFLCAIDSSTIRDGSRTTADGEHLQIMRTSIEDAIRALNRYSMRGSPLVIGL